MASRLKLISGMDIAERRLPQDGRIVYRQFSRKGIDIDLRISTAPLNHGEGVVMRILDKQKSTLPLPALGFSEENLSRYREVIKSPYGMILHCGPTGSGKSMTLYSALNEISDSSIVIRTAEDPIEYTLNGINQMQMNRQIGLTFAAALRAYLRQDPDIILVGEIRDQETANIAVEAALTGHLLISTLHTNDAPGTVARLTDMGIEPFLLSSSLLGVVGQRLVGGVQAFDHAPLVRRQVGDHAVQEQRGLIQQPLRRLHALQHDALGLLPQLCVLFLGELAAGEHHHRQIARLGQLLDLAQQLEAGGIRQVQVEHHAVEGAVAQRFQCRRPAAHRGDVQVVRTQQLGDAQLLGRVVLDHQHRQPRQRDLTPRITTM